MSRPSFWGYTGLDAHLGNTNLLEGAFGLRLVDLESGAVYEQPRGFDLCTRLRNVRDDSA